MSSAEEEDRRAAAEAGLTEAQQAALTAYHSEQNFLLLHRPQLESMRLPKHLWPVLYHKLYNEHYDAGNTFVIAQHDHDDDDDGDGGGDQGGEEDGEDVGFHLVVAAEGGAKAGEDVWIVEHAFTAPDKEAVQRLNAQPALVDRLWDMMDLDRRIRREEVVAERRKRREREEEQRREDRKESDDAAEERKVKQAEDEKERERERLLEREQWTNDDSLACVMMQAEVTREQAAEALIHTRGDLIDAINLVATSKTAGDTDSSPASSSSAAASSSRPAASTTSPASAASADVSSLTEPERRAKHVWDALFAYKYVGCYYTTKPRDERRPLTAADVTAHLHASDEAGSAVVAATDPNAQLHSFMCVTLNTGMSVLWLTKDLEQGEEVIRPIRPAVRKTQEWTSG